MCIGPNTQAAFQGFRTGGLRGIVRNAASQQAQILGGPSAPQAPSSTQSGSLLGGATQGGSLLGAGVAARRRSNSGPGERR